MVLSSRGVDMRDVLRGRRKKFKEVAIEVGRLKGWGCTGLAPLFRRHMGVAIAIAMLTTPAEVNAAIESCVG